MFYVLLLTKVNMVSSVISTLGHLPWIQDGHLKFIAYL